MSESATRMFLVAAIAALSVNGCATGPQSGESSGDRAARMREGALTRESAASRVRQVSHPNYVLWFGLDAEHEDYEGRVVVHFQLREKARDFGSDVALDFEGGVIQSMSINGVPVEKPSDSSRFDGHRVRLKISELTAGANRVEIAFRHPYGTTGSGLHRFKDPVDGAVYLYTDLQPFDAHRVFPCFDQPDLKASYELTVEAPEDWVVIANTMEREAVTVDGRESWAFPPSPLFSTYLFALHAGPYKMWKSEADGIPLRLFARQSLAKHVDSGEWFSIATRGLAFFSTEFGYPYPYSKYDQILVPEFNAGAMENVAAVTFSEDFVHRTPPTFDQRRDRANTILHEMAHMWFGDLVTMRWWNGLWLNESFATFAAALATEEATQFKGSWQSFFSSAKGWAYWEDQLPTTHPIEVSVPDTDQAFANFDGITYGKGAAAIRQLRVWLGEDDFREGLQRYFQKFALRNTTLADFMKMMGEASGQGLVEWQRAWLQSPGLNAVTPRWSCAPDVKGKSTLQSLRLSMSGEPRPHRMKLALLTWKDASKKSLIAKETVDVTATRSETTVEDATGKVCPAAIAVNWGDLDYVKWDIDLDSLAVLAGSVAKIEEPLGREMAWYALWDRVVDGKDSAETFGERVLAFAAQEKNTQILSRLLRWLVRQDPSTESVAKFLSEDKRAPFLAKVEKWALAQAQRAQPGTDVQRAWYKLFLESAATDEGVHFIAAWLDGKKKISGIRLDAERRWQLLRVLARNGFPKIGERLEVELKSDPSDQGHLAAISAEASQPDLMIKSSWLKKIARLEASPLSDARLKAATETFHQLGREALSRNFVDAYFDALPRLASAADEEYLEVFASDLFPSLCDATLAARTQQFIASKPGLPAAALKALRRAGEEESRCVRARERAARAN